MSDLVRLANAVRHARAELRAAQAAANEAQDVLFSVICAERAAQADLDKAIAELVGA